MKFFLFSMLPITVLGAIFIHYASEGAKTISYFLALLSVGISASIGVHFANKIKTNEKTLKQALLTISIIGLLLWPLSYFAVVVTSNYTGATIQIKEMGIIQFSAIMLSLSLLLPSVEHITERYL